MAYVKTFATIQLHLVLGIVTLLSFCCFSTDTRKPDLIRCPENITIAATEEKTVVSWLEPIFTDSLGFRLNITSTFNTNTTSLDWGEQRVEYIAINVFNDRETECVFYVDVTRKSSMTKRRMFLCYPKLMSITFISHTRRNIIFAWNSKSVLYWSVSP